MQKPAEGLVRVLARTAIVGAALLPAVVYLAAEYTSAGRTLARDAEVQAQLLSRYVAERPDGWQFSSEYLVDAVAEARRPGTTTRIFGHRGNEFTGRDATSGRFTLERSAVFHDFGMPTGEILVTADMSPSVYAAGLLAAVGLVVGALLVALLHRFVFTPLDLAEKARRESEARLQDLVDLSVDWFWERDRDLNFRLISSGARAAGLDLSNTLSGNNWEPLVDWSAEQWRTHRARLQARHEFTADYPIRMPGGMRYFRAQGKPRFGAEGEFIGYRGTGRDVTEELKAQEELLIAATAFETEECIMITDDRNRILRVNRAFTRVTGYSAEEAVGQEPALLKSGRHDAEFFQSMWRTLEHERIWRGNIWNRRKNGEIFLCALVITGVAGRNGRVQRYVGSFSDITQHQAAEQKIHQLSAFDSLTGLPNRKSFLEDLGRAINACDRHGGYGAILLIDLDNFKTINDTQGHEVGDLLLREVADRLRAIVRNDDRVARLGGDEFAVMVENLGRDEAAAAVTTGEVGAKILASLNEAFTLRGRDFRATPSIGVVIFHGLDDTPDTLLSRADVAMYRAKSAGRNTLHFFNPAMQETLDARADLERDLRLALGARQFILYFQGQVDREERFIGAEVLLRWRHPSRGMVSPAEFIPLAEESGLILPIGLWVLETACAQLARWSGSPALAGLQLAVNVSARQFRQAGFVDQLKTTLATSGAPPGRLKIELTESMVLGDVEDTIAKMNEIKALGVGFSMDDFGTGYSSLAYLRRLPLDQLKIDQSFVRDVPHDNNDAVIVKTIIGMASSLGFHVIAEGVETPAQRDFLAANACHAYQGYLFARPAPIEEFEKRFGEKSALA